MISLADTPLFLSKISLYWGNYFHRPAVMSKRTPLNTEMNSIIRATAVLIFLKYFIVNRREKRFWYLCLFSKALETFFYASHKQSFSWLEAEDTATTCCHHTDPSMHLNSLQQWAYLSCITRENEKEEGEIGRAKKNVTAYQRENSSYSDYILCQGWKSTTKKALFVNPVVFMLLFPSISIYVCLSLLLLFSKFQPAKHALHRQRDTLDMLFIASYSYVIFFLLGRKPLVCGHKLSICIRSTARSVLAGCLWSGIGGVMGGCERLDSELLEPKGCQDDGVYKGGIERME